MLLSSLLLVGEVSMVNEHVTGLKVGICQLVAYLWFRTKEATVQYIPYCTVVGAIYGYCTVVDLISIES